MVWVDKEYQWIYQSLAYLTQLLILQNFITSITYGNILKKKIKYSVLLAGLLEYSINSFLYLLDTKNNRYYFLFTPISD